jgi:hypothetical protein
VSLRESSKNPCLWAFPASNSVDNKINSRATIHRRSFLAGSKVRTAQPALPSRAGCLTATTRISHTALRQRKGLAVAEVATVFGRVSRGARSIFQRPIAPEHQMSVAEGETHFLGQMPSFPGQRRAGRCAKSRDAPVRILSSKKVRAKPDAAFGDRWAVGQASQAEGGIRVCLGGAKRVCGIDAPQTLSFKGPLSRD